MNCFCEDYQEYQECTSSASLKTNFWPCLFICSVWAAVSVLNQPTSCQVPWLSLGGWVEKLSQVTEKNERMQFPDAGAYQRSKIFSFISTLFHFLLVLYMSLLPARDIQSILNPIQPSTVLHPSINGLYMVVHEILVLMETLAMTAPTKSSLPLFLDLPSSWIG